MGLPVFAVVLLDFDPGGGAQRACSRNHAEITIILNPLMGTVNFTFNEFLAGTVDVNCCNTETEDRVRVYQFMRDLIACRDW